MNYSNQDMLYLIEVNKIQNKKLILILLIAVFISLSGCAPRPLKIDSGLSEKEQAKEFSLQIVKTYFDKNCDAFYDALSDTVYLLDDDGPFEKNSGIKKKLCESIAKGVRGEYTFQDYLNSYDVRILEKTEYETEFKVGKDLQKFKPTLNDYLFVGYKVKANKTNFMWDDLLVFMVRKTETGWKISALSG